VFDLVEEIGEGTFSTVYLAARRGGGARVALKHLVPTSKPSRIAMEVECMEKGSESKYLNVIK
jgi:serine/threonine protein kinase